jgi:hypothetical protein
VADLLFLEKAGKQVPVNYLIKAEEDNQKQKKDKKLPESKVNRSN